MTKLQRFLDSFRNSAVWIRIWLVSFLMFSMSALLALIGGQTFVLGYLISGVVLTAFGVLLNLACLQYYNKRKNE